MYARNSVPPASDYDGRVVEAVPTAKARHNHWAGDTSLASAGVGSNLTRYHVFLITFQLA